LIRFPFGRAGTARPLSFAGAPETVPLLALLEPELQSQVRRRLAKLHVRAGKHLYRQGEPADALYLVESGRLRVCVGEGAGRERVLLFAGPGDMVGESAFMAETPHITNAVAVEPARVWRLARADFDTLVAGHEPVLRYLAGVIAERQQQANSRLAVERAPDETRALRGYVTAVYSPRGGSGVTTLATTLGIALAERHPDDVVLLDLDVLFGDALSNLWLQPRGVLAGVAPVSFQALDRAGLDFYLRPHASSLRVLAAANRPEDGQTVTGEHVRAAVTNLRRHFGYLVLDLPHSFSEATLVGLELADRVLIVATPEQVSLRDLLECRRIFVEVLGLASERISYVLNHPLPYAGVSLTDCIAATHTPWIDVGFGGEAPTAAALRGESLPGTRPHNPVTKAVLQLAEAASREAREGALVSGQSSGVSGQ
jgi:pilus assembly protein CpaE